MGVLSVCRSFKVKLLFASVLLSYLFYANLRCKGEEILESETIVENFEELPFCDEDIIEKRDMNKRLLYVTTLDGKLSALDLTQNGSLEWSVETGPGSLLSSSIHRLELTNNGNMVRLIPSLSGGLYKFDGESLEVIPITADELLKSSFKFSDDLVISGGKETRSYGVSSRTGQVIYECSMTGCKNRTDSLNVQESDEVFEEQRDEREVYNPLLDDVIVIRRQTETVRAVEPRSGSERWNFSIGHHELELLHSKDCHPNNKNDDEFDQFLLDMDIRVIVPEGLICAFSKKSPTTLLWKHKFNNPIVSAWKTNQENEIENIDLFSNAQWLWNDHKDYYTKPSRNSDKEETPGPSLYLGMFQKQLYIQESRHMRKYVHKQMKIHQNLITDETNYPRIPWKPYPASTTSSSLLAIESYEVEGANEEEDQETFDLVKMDDGSTALSVLYSTEYINGNGFFLYSPENHTNHQFCEKKQKITNSNLAETEEIPIFNENVKFVVVSLWYWWKEIIVIALTTAFLLNLLINNRISSEREIVYVEKPVEVPVIMGKDAIEFEEEKELIENQKVRSVSEGGSSNSPEFVSRFLSDFELVRPLGRGGFGLVYEVQNKLDGMSYAIKRIVLPKKKESRDRVMREVKTLANCEHKNIVRYFQAWMETPPPKWQEEKDKEFFAKDLSTSILIDSPSPTDDFSKISFPSDTPVKSFKSPNDLRKNVLKKNSSIQQYSSKEEDDSIVFQKLHSTLNSTSEEDSLFYKKADDSNDSSDGGIVFENSNHNETNASSDGGIVFQNSINESNMSSLHTNNKKLDEDTSDGGIVFQDSSVQIDIQEKSDIVLISMESDDKQSNKKKTHKRPLSLDLSQCKELRKTVNSQQNSKLRMYLYIQMQLCKKQSLKDWLRNNDLKARNGRAFEIFDGIVSAVHYVHLKGLIHRDLKPSNIFFAQDDTIKIGDFGLVTDMSDTSDDSSTSGSSSARLYNNSDNSNNLFQYNHKKHTQQVGTHLYMSPEQSSGLPYNYKVDIYSLGLILFELLVHFGTETERVIVLTGLKNHKFPTHFQESFSEEFEVLKIMLARKPENRPTTYGVRARPPLKKIYGEEACNAEYEFELPPRRRESSSFTNNKV